MLYVVLWYNMYYVLRTTNCKIENRKSLPATSYQVGIQVYMYPHPQIQIHVFMYRSPASFVFLSFCASAAAFTPSCRRHPVLEGGDAVGVVWGGSVHGDSFCGSRSWSVAELMNCGSVDRHSSVGIYYTSRPGVCSDCAGGSTSLATAAHCCRTISELESGAHKGRGRGEDGYGYD